jgi:hypothetical protein
VKSPEEAMSGLIAKFTEHPASVGETYFEHMESALSFAGPLFLAACFCLVHAFLPFLFEKTGSSYVTRLHERMVVNRARLRNVKPGILRAAPDYVI